MKRFGRVLLNLTVLFAILCAALMVLPSILGYHRYVILTGSMTGTYDRGSIVFDKQIPVADLKVGDPITYNPPPGASPQKRVTHRVYSMHRDKQGNQMIRTKGDANKKPDSWTFELSQPNVDKVDFSVPYLGYLFMFLSIPEYRIWALGIPALLAALWVCRKLWKEAGKELARQQGELEPGEDVLEVEPPDLEPLPVAERSEPQPVFVELPWQVHSAA